MSYSASGLIAAPPSSPPIDAHLLPEFDANLALEAQLACESSAVTLPRRLATDVSLPRPLHGRKRPRNSSTPYADSSDSPLFSSDGADAGAEAYTQRRKKRAYHGPWWRATPGPGLPTRRMFRRNFDSGVFMGSDSSEAFDSDPLEVSRDTTAETTSTTATVPPIRRDLHPGRDDLRRALHEPVDDAALETLYANQQRAVAEISVCVDRGNPVIDLTGLGLRTLLRPTLRPLHYLVCHGSDQPFTPQLSLYLANNDLTTVPAPVLQLPHLTTLSVRGNSITELPPQLGHLTELVELNVASNRLRYLPYALMGLFRAAQGRRESVTEFLQTRLRLGPNPLVQPVRRVLAKEEADSQPDGDPASESEDAEEQPEPAPSLLPAPSDRLVCRARSVCCYLTIHGAPLRAGLPCPSRPQTSCRLFTSASAPSISSEPNVSRVPSLFELALRAASPYAADLLGSCSSTDAPSSTPACAFTDAFPAAVIAGLQRAAAPHDEALRCDVCARTYVVPRAEWLEWWAGVRDHEDELVPLLRRVCSWACAGEVCEATREEEMKREEMGTEEETGIDEGWRGCGWREV